MFSSAWAEDAVVTVHVIEMEQPVLSELLSKNLAGEPLVEEIRRIVTIEAARFYNTCLLRCSVGSRASMESTSELIYPTEYAGWELPPSREYQERLMKRARGWWDAWPFMPVLSGFSGDFEVRSIGEAFEISALNQADPHDSPFESGQGWALEFVTRKADIVFLKHPALQGPDFKESFPQFQTQRIQGKQLDPGTWRTVGVMTEPKDGGGPGDKLLTIMKVELLEDTP
ncbi:hypothetical protein [Haloferula sp.]|uniref:hypothetical protein n=1 Tax=Haloferula sp. TaxID=2497595 RepID=UPI003C7103B3